MFTTDVKLRKIAKKKHFLIMPLAYEGAETIVIPAGFTTAYTDAPRILRDYITRKLKDQARANRLFKESKGPGPVKRAWHWAARVLGG